MTPAITVEGYRMHHGKVVPTVVINQEASREAILQAALELVARWELPAAGHRFVDGGDPVPFTKAFGSSGERNFIQGVATAVLAYLEREESVV